MISRRDLMIGGACVAAAAGAYALEPRREVSILGNRSLDEIVPKAFGTWASQDVGSLIAPKIEGSLSDQLYSQTVQRVYADEATGGGVMMLLAHGARNTDKLQLHRPESCYPAFGFKLSSNKAIQLRLRPDVSIPARSLVADAPGRREIIVYWSRLGEFLPVNGSEQRRDRFRTALGGYIPDGLLARFSAIGAEPAQVVPMLETFVLGLVGATPAKDRDALVGTLRAKALAVASK